MTTLTTTHDHDFPLVPPKEMQRDLWTPLRRWLDRLQVRNRKFAHLVCQLIPCCCPFERDITLLGRIYHIPALCKLNPLYNELVFLRFRALNYLADVCHEDVTQYIC